MENVMVKAFGTLVADPAYGGRYVSLTPGHPNKISDDEYNKLVKVDPTCLSLSLSVCLSRLPEPNPARSLARLLVLSTPDPSTGAHHVQGHG